MTSPSCAYRPDDTRRINQGREREHLSLELTTLSFPFRIDRSETSPRLQEIHAFRKAVFSHVPNRDHSPTQTFTHDNDQMERVAFGEAAYQHHAGHQTGITWAARYRFAKERGEFKFAYCRIIIVGNGDMDMLVALCELMWGKRLCYSR